MILVWAVALLTLMLLTAALLLTTVLQSTYFEKVVAESLSKSELAVYHEVYEYFGTFTRSLFSMFEITLANYPPVTRLLAEEVSEWFMLITVLHKLTIGFAVVGVINGVILQETFKVAGTDDVIMVRQKKKAVATLRHKMLSLLK